ncbi:hypothetical protein BCR36DRAFT_414817 [Piromyces finnis]|uniref:SH3 domain-containing protein n=1 Tax=Piromyces finnis TaxID=1754191 RepID=A0A1Y1V0W4_9FUNG|nr:hypothetical protein BCR36DRAFT_414817 [Piromyces finnis]|eukprot:ORX44847.1 hypothetical protein BCR36DRAFT_414817 [Piromyces finnis]
MKYLNLFLSTILFASAALGGSKLDACPLECTLVNDCVVDKNVNGVYSLYPPKGELGKCFCSNVQQYFDCLNCAQQSENKKPYAIGTFNSSCNKITGNTGVAISTGAAGTTGTNTGLNGTNANNGLGTGTNGATGTLGNMSENNQNINKNSTSTDTKENEDEKPKSSKIPIIVIAIVAIAGVAGFFVYTRKQKERPESMPFFGNSASSPNQYATLGSKKEMTDISTSNLTTDYNTQFYPNVDSNQYNYNQGSNATYNNFEQSRSEYNNQYDSNYQDYNNQYPSGNYENEVAVASNINVISDSAQYESRRESMMPGSQPTSTNFNGAYVCAYKYDPQLDDELELQVNDQVQIIEEYEDGWMKAINLTTGKEGMAPRVCIKEA